MIDDNLITVNKKSVARELGNILGAMLRFYTKFNTEIILFWRRLLPTSDKKVSLIDATLGKESFALWLSNFIRILLDNPLTALFINIFTLYIIAGFFGGRISEILMYVAFFNLLTMMLQVLGVIDKLQKK